MKQLCILFLLVCVACDEPLLNDLSEKQVSSALLDLHFAGIAARKQKTANGWSIHVNDTSVARATAVLTKSGMLKRLEPSGASEQKRLLMSRSERTHLLEVSIANRIEDTFEALPGVLDARVNLFLAKQTAAFGAEKRQPSASAVLIVTGSFSVEKDSLVRILEGAAAIEKERIEIVLVSDDRFEQTAGSSERHESANNPEASAVRMQPLTSYFLSNSTLMLIALGSGFLFLLVVMRAYRKRKAIKKRRQVLRTGSHASSDGLFTSVSRQEELVQ